jgi:hypothetical protein
VRTYIAPPARVNMIAPRTRPYVAASPSVGSPGSPAHTAYTMTRGPSMGEAHVPASSVPAQRVDHDARAVSFARMHPPSRSFGTPQAGGAFTGRSEVMPRPSTFPSAPGSSVYSTRPLPPTGASMPRPDVYAPRPYTPSPVAPMHPAMPVVPRSSPVAPSIPRSYSPPSAPMEPAIPRYSPPSVPYSRPAPMAPSAPMVRPSAPAPAVRPSAPPAVNAPRPSMAPSVRSAPVAPRISR